MQEQKIRKLIFGLLVSLALVFMAGFLLPEKALAEDWTNVGSAGFSASQARFTSLAFNPVTDEPYVAYKDDGSSGKLTVKKFNGTSWETVGTVGFSTDEIMAPISLAFNPATNEPYVAYIDDTETKVKKFNGSAWTNVGSESFSGQLIVLAFNPSTNDPYIAFTDLDNSSKASVLLYNGAAWVNVGTAGFTNGTAEVQGFSFSSITNIPYISFIDGNLSSHYTVMKLNGVTWEVVGSGGFADASASDLAINQSTGNPYVAIRDADNSDKATVLFFNGSSWVVVGSAGFSSNMIDQIKIAFNDATNEPYVFISNDTTSIPTVMKFDDSDWVNVGNSGFSDGEVNFIDLAFNPSTDEPYTAFSDETRTNKMTVMKYANAGDEENNGNNDKKGTKKERTKYKHYKAVYKNKISKSIYLEIRNIKRTNKAEFDKMKALFVAHKKDKKAVFDKLDTKTKELFLKYKKYNGYRNYKIYKVKVGK